MWHDIDGWWAVWMLLMMVVFWGGFIALAIWAAQAESGAEPCFATEHRFQCTRKTCPWWDECQGLQADWRR